MRTGAYTRPKLLILAWPENNCFSDWNLVNRLFSPLADAVQQELERQQQNVQQGGVDPVDSYAVILERLAYRFLWQMDWDSAAALKEWMTNAQSGKAVELTLAYKGGLGRFQSIQKLHNMHLSMANDLRMHHMDRLQMNNAVRNSAGFRLAMTISNPYTTEGIMHRDMPLDVASTGRGQILLPNGQPTKNYIFVTFVLYLQGGNNFSSVAPGLMSTVVSNATEIEQAGDGLNTPMTYSIPQNPNAALLNSSSFNGCQMSVFPSNVPHSVGPNPGSARAAIACKVCFARSKYESPVTWSEIYDWLQQKSGMSNVALMDTTPSELATQYGTIVDYPDFFAI